MSKAAYDRGTLVIRQQIDRELADKPKPHPDSIALMHAKRVNENLRQRIESLESELAKAKQYLAIARSERNLLKQEIVERENKYQFLFDCWESSKKRADQFKRSWEKASRLLRMLPPHLVAEARADGEHRN